MLLLLPLLPMRKRKERRILMCQLDDWLAAQLQQLQATTTTTKKKMMMKRRKWWMRVATLGKEMAVMEEVAAEGAESALH